jgi:inactive STAND
MLWIEFLQKIIDNEACSFGKVPKKRFLKIFEHEDSKKYDVEQCQLAQDYYSEETEETEDLTKFAGYLTEIYKAMEPLNLELLKSPRGRYPGPTRKYYHVHLWLRQLYDAEQQSLERQHQASAPVLTIEHALHEQLKKFNYFPQQGQFCEVVNQERCSAFLIRVDGEATQTWLARRLAEEIPNFLGSKRVRIDMRGHSIPPDLFAELAREILNTVSGCDKDEIIEEVAQFCKTRNITIALYGVDELEKEHWESLRDFWERLVKAIDRGKCTLLLTEDATFQCPIKLSKLHELTTWETVPTELWENWVARREVQELLESCRSTNATQAFSSAPPTKPQRALERICNKFTVNDKEAVSGKEAVIKVMTDKIWNLAA